jgi:hypothetical protein
MRLHLELRVWNEYALDLYISLGVKSCTAAGTRKVEPARLLLYGLLSESMSELVRSGE